MVGIKTQIYLAGECYFKNQFIRTVEFRLSVWKVWDDVQSAVTVWKKGQSWEMHTHSSRDRGLVGTSPGVWHSLRILFQTLCVCVWGGCVYNAVLPLVWESGSEHKPSISWPHSSATLGTYFSCCLLLGVPAWPMPGSSCLEPCLWQLLGSRIQTCHKALQERHQAVTVH